jgi:hypothetical protein
LYEEHNVDEFLFFILRSYLCGGRAAQHLLRVPVQELVVDGQRLLEGVRQLFVLPRSYTHTTSQQFVLQEADWQKLAAHPKNIPTFSTISKAS